jgi:chromate reductase, NAD(P)H dehydrogenase (quinone)
VNTSPRARHAYESIREVLQTMSTCLVAEASLPLLGACITEEAMIATPHIRQSIETLLSALVSNRAGASMPGPSFPLA